MGRVRIMLLWAVMAGVGCPVMLGGCSSGTTTTLAPDERVAEGYERAVALFDKQDYRKASLELERLLFTSRATAYEDKVLFLLAESYFRSGQYLLAIDMYERLLRQVPSSSYAPTARFMLARSNEELSPNFELDQEHTRQAIEEFSLYVDFYGRRDPEVVARDADTYHELLKLDPTNREYQRRYEALAREAARGDSVMYAVKAVPELREKLAHRYYAIAQQYMQLQHYKAATIYFEALLRTYPDSEWYHPAWKGTIEAMAKRGKWMDARRAMDQYLERYPERLDEVKDLRNRILSHFENS